VAADPWGVLVVPVAGDPGGLTTPGRCNARPPMATSSHTCGYLSHREWTIEPEPRACYMCRHPMEALTLWWDGALVPEGWDRARRVIWNRLGWAWDDEMVALLSEMEPTVAQAITVAGWLVVPGGPASRVVLLDLTDGRLVERGGSDV
jgi:hypothetical protein